MQTNVRSVLLTALAVTVGAMILSSAGAPTAAVAQQASPAPSADLTAKVQWLEKMVKYLQTEIATVKAQVRKEQGTNTGGAGAKNSPTDLAKKIEELQKKLEGHTHEYLLEGRASDGSIQARPQDQFPGSGLNSTGGARVGKAVIH